MLTPQNPAQDPTSAKHEATPTSTAGETATKTQSDPNAGNVKTGLVTSASGTGADDVFTRQKEADQQTKSTGATLSQEEADANREKNKDAKSRPGTTEDADPGAVPTSFKTADEMDKTANKDLNDPANFPNINDDQPPKQWQSKSNRQVFVEVPADQVVFLREGTAIKIVDRDTLLDQFGEVKSRVRVRDASGNLVQAIETVKGGVIVISDGGGVQSYDTKKQAEANGVVLE